MDLLDQVSGDDPRATSALMERVYDQLHRLAAAYMRRERGDHTLQTTALVHEASCGLSASGISPGKIGPIFSESRPR